MLAFIEAIFFPLPPDLILIPLAFADPQNALLYALVATVFSALGGVGGHWVGATAGKALMEKFVSKRHAHLATRIYKEHGPLALGVAALTPIPYKAFTILSGILGMDWKTLFAVSLIGRGIRFFAEAAMIMIYGDDALAFISGNFEMAAIAACVLLTLIYLCYIYIKKKYM
ncbi:MAG: VTT domain-containing protein [Candidatus Micrarchaeota archaeon]|nr:VTT domain-containing protein [Candidatus Micrarchaeota archaeon]